jgi:hypothetical protein
MNKEWNEEKYLEQLFLFSYPTARSFIDNFIKTYIPKEIQRWKNGTLASIKLTKKIKELLGIVSHNMYMKGLKDGLDLAFGIQNLAGIYPWYLSANLVRNYFKENFNNIIFKKKELNRHDIN